MTSCSFYVCPSLIIHKYPGPVLPCGTWTYHRPWALFKLIDSDNETKTHSEKLQQLVFLMSKSLTAVLKSSVTISTHLEWTVTFAPFYSFGPAYLWSTQHTTVTRKWVPSWTFCSSAILSSRTTLTSSLPFCIAVIIAGRKCRKLFNFTKNADQQIQLDFL